MIPIKQEKEKKVEIVKDINSVTDSEKELASQKEQERKERIFLIQLMINNLITIFKLLINQSNIIIIFLQILFIYFF